MNTLDDLRTALADRADVTDRGLAGRAADAARRGRVVRRRRRVAVAGTAVAIVAAAAGVSAVVSPDDDRPVAAGVPVPVTMEATGFTFDYDRTVDPGSGRASVALAVSDEPRLVSWATSGVDQDVAVTTSFDDDFHSSRPDFADWVWIEPGERWSVDVEAAAGDVGLAVFTLGRPGPEGFVGMGDTFRDPVAGMPLLNAASGHFAARDGAGDAEGETSIGTEFTLPAGDVALTSVCTVDGLSPAELVRRTEFRMEVDGRFVGGGSCDPAGSVFDPTPETVISHEGLRGDGLRPGDRVPLSISVAGRDGEPLPRQAVVTLGVAAYDALSRSPVTGSPAPAEIVESGGHTWRLAGTTPLRPGLARQRAAAPAVGERLQVRYWVEAAGQQGGFGVSLLADGRRLVDGSRTNMGAYGSGATVDRGTRSVTLRSSAPIDSGWIAFYELAD